MARRVYDLNGPVIEVGSGDEGLAGYLGAILAPLEVDGGDAPDWTIAVSAVASVDPAPPGTQPIWHGPLPEGIDAVLYDHCARQVLRAPGHFSIAHHREGRVSEIIVAPAGRNSVGGTAAFWLLDRILVAHDRHLLHGACLVARSPLGAIALFAPSGTGKTTTALALAGAGLGLAGDDALVLENAQDESYLWAVPRRFRVHRRTADLLPWLGPHLSKWESDEQAIEQNALHGVIDLPGPIRCPAAGAIVLLKPNLVGHRVAPITKIDALSHVVSDNVHRAPGGVPVDGQAAFAAIARFIARTPVVSLSVGPEPGSLDAEMILAALASVRRDRAPE